MPAKTNEITNWQLMQKQVWYYRKHLDIFIQQQCAPVKLTPTQRIIVRQVGNCNDIKDICSRGYGKTLVIALAVHGLAVLYPGTAIGVVSATAKQATLVIGKLKQISKDNVNILNEMVGQPHVSRDTSYVEYKNGSRIESFATESMRGQRCKVVIIDEALDMNQEQLDAVVAPTMNARRAISFNYGFDDFKSKRIAISSASEKSNDMYQDFVRILKQMARGNRQAFCCALDYTAAVHDGISAQSYFEAERSRMPAQIFNIEYGSIFAGSSANSAFPRSLIENCRVLQNIELQQPKNSKSRYIMSVDIATSESKSADNTIISVIKFNESSDGSIIKKLVYMRSFHGFKLDKLANEIRILAHVKFPNVEKIIYDARGVGDSLSRFFKDDWVDITSGKEYPPLADDDVPSYGSAIQMLHPIRAVLSLNQRIYTNMRVSLEQRSLQLPISLRLLVAKVNEQNDEKKNKRRLSVEERAVYLQGDTLMIEMGNVVGKVGASGNVIYDTPKASMHKDRYSSLAYGVDYICEIEKQNTKKRRKKAPCVGLVSALPNRKEASRFGIY